MHLGFEILSNLAVVFRIPADKQLPMFLVELFATGSKCGALVMKHKGAVCRHGRISIAIDAANEIILFVVAGTISWIKQAEAIENHGFHKHAESDGSRHNRILR